MNERNEKLLRLEQSREKEDKSNFKLSLYQSRGVSQEYSTLGNATNFKYSEEDFGPPLSASPDLASTPPANMERTFAAMMKVPSPNSWTRSRDNHSSNDESTQGWKFELPDHVFDLAIGSSTTPNSDSTLEEAVAVIGAGKKKKNKGIMLFGNGGARGRS